MAGGLIFYLSGAATAVVLMYWVRAHPQQRKVEAPNWRRITTAYAIIVAFRWLGVIFLLIIRHAERQEMGRM